jgi:hypothetical protein
VHVVFTLLSVIEGGGVRFVWAGVLYGYLNGYSRAAGKRWSFYGCHLRALCESYNASHYSALYRPRNDATLKLHGDGYHVIE